MGGLVIGLAESFVPSEYSGYREAISFTLLFLMLLIRPQGLFGRSQTAKV
jgi:branched-chain amino acid transport system permease protein